jgi:type II secretory pathway component PulF
VGAERRQVRPQGGELDEGVAHAPQFTRVAQTVLQAAEDSGNVADLPESVAQLSQGQGMLPQLSDE